MTETPFDTRGSLNADDLRGPVLITFLSDRLPRPFLAVEDAEVANQAIVQDAADLAAELPAGVHIRGARMSVGRGAGTVLPAIELFRAVTDDAARLAFWAGTSIAFAAGVKRAYRYITTRIGHQALLSPEALIQLAASEVLESKDAPEHLRFVSITSVGDLHHVYSTSPYLPYDYGDVFVIILTAGHDQGDYDIYGFVMASDGTTSHKWMTRVDHNGHPV